MPDGPVNLIFYPHASPDGLEKLVSSVETQTPPSEARPRVKYVSQFLQLITELHSPGRISLVYDSRSQLPSMAANNLKSILSETPGHVKICVLADESERNQIRDGLEVCTVGKALYIATLDQMISNPSALYEPTPTLSPARKTAMVALSEKNSREKAAHILQTSGAYDVCEARSLSEAMALCLEKDLVFVETPWGEPVLKKLNGASAQTQILTYVNLENGLPRKIKPQDFSRRLVDQIERDSTNGAGGSIPRPLRDSALLRQLASLGEPSRLHGAYPSPKPSQWAEPRAKRSNYVYLVRGPSCVGKTTLVNKLLDFLGEERAVASVKTSNRPKRPEDKEGGIIHLTEEQIKENDAKGLYFSTYEFGGYLYAIDKGILPRFQSGSDVFVRAHVKDDMTRLEKAFPGQLVDIILFADEESLDQRLEERNCSERAREMRRRTNKEELEEILSDKHKYHYTVRTDELKSPETRQPLHTTESNMNETIRKLANIVHWQSYHASKPFVDTLLQALTGFNAREIENRPAAAAKLKLRFSRELLQQTTWYDASSRMKALQDGITILGGIHSWEGFSIYIQAPDHPLERECLRRLITTRLSKYVQPQYVADCPAISRDFNFLDLADLSGARYQEILRYGLNDPLPSADVRRNKAIDLGRLQEIRASPKMDYLNICIVSRRPDQEFKAEPYSPDALRYILVVP